MYRRSFTKQNMQVTIN